MGSDAHARDKLDRTSPGAWLIAGPTASGKSALALALAERLGGEIVNADALQVYADLAVLTARPAAADLARVSHHLYGVADAAERWSVGRWLRAALPVLDAIAGRGRTAVVVGGTGLYFAALTRGLADTPPVPDAIRESAQARFDRDGEKAFRAVLAAVDPQAAVRISPGDRQRLSRAFAVHAATGKALSAWRDETRPPLALGSWRGVVLEPPRAALYARCDARLESMIAGGALEEAARLDARGLAPDLPALKAVGYRELAAVARGELSRAQGLEAAARETRRYAKRQSTWFRNQTPDWTRITTLDPAGQLDAWLALAGHGGSVARADEGGS